MEQLSRDGRADRGAVVPDDRFRSRDLRWHEHGTAALRPVRGRLPRPAGASLRDVTYLRGRARPNRQPRPGHTPGPMSNPPAGYPRVSPYLLYEDAPAAIEYLQQSFGFELRLSQIGGAGRMHNELLLGDDGLVMLGQAGEGFSSPRSLGSFPSALVHVYVDDVEALHVRAKNAGADVTDLELSPVGDH